jgi:predicted RNA binding protein YcfA (HicA-like mRNA interferase family)
MPKHVPSLKPRELIKLLEKAGCSYYREGKEDHRLYMRVVEGRKRVVPIDMGANELSPVYVIRIFRQFGFKDNEIQNILRKK